MKKEKNKEKKESQSKEKNQQTNKNKNIVKEIGTYNGFLIYENKDKIKESDLKNEKNLNDISEPSFKDWLIIQHNPKKTKSRFSNLFEEILENDRKLEQQKKEQNNEKIENYLLPNNIINDIDDKDEIKINENDNNIINDDNEIDDIKDQMENINLNNNSNIYEQDINKDIIINKNEININSKNNNNNNIFNINNNDLNFTINNSQNNNFFNNNFSNINNINNFETINLNNIPNNNNLMRNNILFNQNQTMKNKNTFNNINNINYPNNMNQKFLNSIEKNNNSNSGFPSAAPTAPSSFDRKSSIFSFMSNSSGIFNDKNNIAIIPNNNINNNNKEYLFFSNTNQFQEPNKKQNLRSSEKKFDLNIDLKRIIYLEDRRTTLMIKNIPNKFKRDLLLNIINQNFRTAYDLFILPTDSYKYKNFGYSFINFTCSYYIPYFYFLFHKKKWSSTNSQKVCEITYSKIQGKNNLLSHYAKNIIYKNEYAKNNDISEQKFIIPNEYFNIFNSAFPNYNIEKFETYFMTKMPFRY